MKLFILAAALSALSCSTAFVVPSAVRAPTPLRAEGCRHNTAQDLDSPKVVTQEKLAAGDKKVYCRCWKSGTFPLCDAAHVTHNKETGDNVGPLIVAVAKE